MLTITNVHKTYTSGIPVLHNINLTVAEGEIVCLLGPSGCGKTTLLRIVAGLEEPDSGQLTLAGRDLRQMPVHQRNFGLMFQEFALFPHRTVAENVAFGLRMAGQSRDQIKQRVQEVLTLVNLAGYGDRSIFALSGGERQRVALARSLAPHPRLLMLDEPLGSLDRALREELMVELRTILKAVGVTALYVTHDQQEAFAVADRLVVMRQGQIEQIGPPPAIYDTPASAFVARFLGFHNLLPLGQEQRSPALAALLQQAEALMPTPAATAQVNAQLLLRPDAVRTLGCGASPASDANPLVVSGTIVALLFRGSFYQITVRLGEAATAPELRFDVPTFVINAATKGNAAALQSGQPIWLLLDPAALTVIA
ncbi:MAG: ABC transporter ATP-binding protein [Caldilinea sp. CFX5]|nr:ABC transporter ATP-binding protein [Caldilinea sp. CFX5]